MKIILYNNNSENNKINKNIAKIVELEGYLREEASLINPQIMIEFYPEVFGKYIKDDNEIYVVYDGMKITWDTFINQYVLSANYVYIPDFNRYYFINDIISVRNNLWRITCNVDVLMSYKNQILDTNAFVARNQNEFNKDVVDNECVLTDKEEVEFTEVEVDLFNDNPQTPYVLTMIADY